ncbi:D-sedoheptulose-7-phosphate isomerase [Streptomyces sp. NPDC001073]
MTVTPSPAPASTHSQAGQLSVIAQSAHHLLALSREDLDACTATVAWAVTHGSDIYTVGNGGSATTASHLTCDLANHPVVAGRLARVHTVHDLARTTAVANDNGYDDIFARPLRALLREGDLLIAISVSGRSPNIVKALTLAREQHATTMAFLGSDGGEARALSDTCLIVPSDDPGVVESVHLAVVHEIAAVLRDSTGTEALARDAIRGGG